jgi:hypothetical protein
MRNKKGQYVKVKRTVLRASNKGRNARGTCAHKRTKYAKKAKRQQVGGFSPSPTTGGGALIG